MTSLSSTWRKSACHSEPGFIDFLGADGTAAGIVDGPAPIQSPIGCVACHTSAAHDLDSVTFPSGVEIGRLEASATCMVCHQGRQIERQRRRCRDRHGGRYHLRETQFPEHPLPGRSCNADGASTCGGYQYPGKRYAGRFTHVPSADSCVDCPSPHTTRVKTDGCLSCHRKVDSLTDIRTTHVDFDGDGDRAEGIHGEIVTLHRRLGEAISIYAAEVAGMCILYEPDRHPVFLCRQRR